MNGFKFLLFSIMVSIGIGCASVTKDIKVISESKPSIEINNYKTYNWIATATVLRDPEGRWKPTGMDVDKELRRIIDNKLQYFGLKKSEIKPELNVGYAIGIDMGALGVKVNQDTDELLLKNIPQGALAVILSDAVTGNIVWTSVATADIHENPTDDIIRTRFKYAIDKMFDAIPNTAAELDY